MDEKKSALIAVVFFILFLIAGYCAVNTELELGRVRQANRDLEARNFELELRNSELTRILDAYEERLDRIASRIDAAQRTASAAADAVSRIRALVGAIEEISRELRKPVTAE